MDLPSPPPPQALTSLPPSTPIDAPLITPPPFPPATDFPPVPFFSETTYYTTGSASSTSYLLRIEQTYLISGTSTSSYPSSATTIVGLPFLTPTPTFVATGLGADDGTVTGYKAFGSTGVAAATEYGVVSSTERSQATLTTSHATSTVHASQTTSRSTASGDSSSYSSTTTRNSETETETQSVIVVVAKGRATWGPDTTSAAAARGRGRRSRKRTRVRVGVGIAMWVLWRWWGG